MKIIQRKINITEFLGFGGKKEPYDKVSSSDVRVAVSFIKKYTKKKIPCKLNYMQAFEKYDDGYYPSPELIEFDKLKISGAILKVPGFKEPWILIPPEEDCYKNIMRKDMYDMGQLSAESGIDALIKISKGIYIGYYRSKGMLYYTLSIGGEDMPLDFEGSDYTSLIQAIKEAIKIKPTGWEKV
jgi:hypothetical protein